MPSSDKLKLYANAIVETIRQPLLLLDGDLRVQFANPAFREHFAVSPDETLGRFVYEWDNAQWDIAELRRLLEGILPEQNEFQGYEFEHDFPKLGKRTLSLHARMMRGDDQPAMILLVIDDLTEQKRLEEELVGQKEFAEKTVDTIREPLLVMDWDLRVKSANESFYETFRVSPGETQGRLIYELGNGQWNIPRLRELLENVLPENDAFDDYEVEHDFPELGRRTMLLNARRIDHLMLILLAIEDITERRAVERRRQFLIHLNDTIRDLDDPCEVAKHVATAVAEHLEVSQAAYATVDEDTGTIQMVHHNRRREAINRDQYPLDEFGPEILQHLRTGQSLITSDLEQDSRTADHWQAFDSIRARAMVGVPIIKDERLRAVFLVSHPQPRDWSVQEVALIEQIAERTHFGVERAEALRSIYESEGRLQNAIKITTVGIIFWDSEMRISQANEAFLTMTGFDHDEVIGQSWRELTPPEFHPLSERAMEELRETGEITPYEKQYYRRDGSRWWGLFAGRKMDRTTVVEFVLDITQRKQSEEALRESEERYRTLFESIDQGFCVIEVLFDEADEPVDYRFLEVNPAFTAQAGIENPVGRRMREIAPEHEAYWFEIYGRVARTGEPVQFQNGSRALGRYFDVEAFRIGDPDEHRVAVLFNDITEQQQAEDALRESEERLRQLNDVLEERVAERTAELQEREQRLRALAMELSRAEQHERTRLAQVLHDDVQQLLVAVQMRLAFLSDDALSERALEDLRRTEEILSQAQQALRSLSVELAPPVLQERGLGAGLEWLAKRMQDHHGLEVEIAADPAAEEGAEPFYDLLFQVVRELLLNVVKHAGTHRANVRFEHRDSQVHLEVEDAGRGCDPVEMEKHAGHSFGLFHIRERLRHVGGDLVLESAPGQGTRVRVTVPLVKLRTKPEEEARDQATSKRSGETGRRVQVLLVDDHQTVREGLARLLEREPELEIIGQADDGRQAVTLARELKPDIIVMDVSMPGMNGIEATRRIKRELPHVRVIGLSLHAEEDMAQAMLDAGAERYLTKGGPSADLTAAIRSLRN